jgi:hypothetical protein
MQVSGLVTPQEGPPDTTGERASCDHTATTDGDDDHAPRRADR